MKRVLILWTIALAMTLAMYFSYSQPSSGAQEPPPEFGNSTGCGHIYGPQGGAMQIGGDVWPALVPFVLGMVGIPILRRPRAPRLSRALCVSCQQEYRLGDLLECVKCHEPVCWGCADYTTGWWRCPGCRERGAPMA